MKNNIDIKKLYDKLDTPELVTKQELEILLKQVEHYQWATTFLADCHAATAESLPKSASKTDRARHVVILDLCAQLLDGQLSKIGHKVTPKDVQTRCVAIAKILKS